MLPRDVVAAVNASPIIVGLTWPSSGTPETVVNAFMMTRDGDG
jgi:hypothetical protein